MHDIWSLLYQNTYLKFLYKWFKLSRKSLLPILENKIIQLTRAFEHAFELVIVHLYFL